MPRTPGTTGSVTAGKRPPARRALLAGLGLLGGGAIVQGGAASAAPTGAGAAGLPVLEVGQDWSDVLARTPRIQLVPGATYRLSGQVELPDGCLIVGNGATVTVGSDTVGALVAHGRRDIVLTGIRFAGRAEDPINTPPEFAHVAVRLTRCTNVRLDRCDFRYWRGAGVVVTGAAADDYFGYQVKVHGCSFERCYFGLSAADRSEYSQVSDCSFTYCRLAIWNSSGNWTVSGNIVVGCHGAYYAVARTSPYGALASDNWNHSSVTGNTFNHSNGGARALWRTGAAFGVGGVEQDLGPGIVVMSLLPPTFTGNTLWYTDVRAVDVRGTRWLLSGNTFSNLTITALGAVPVALVGNQSNAGSGPTLAGNVKDLLASLY